MRIEPGHGLGFVRPCEIGAYLDDQQVPERLALVKRQAVWEGMQPDLAGGQLRGQEHTDAEWRAGVTLWMKSWDQVPAGSLPVDDVALCRLAELGRDLKSWKKIKVGAMRGWILCTDGRMYHPTVAEGVNHALEAKAAQRSKTAAARIASLQKKLTAATDTDEKQRLTVEIEKIQQTLRQVQSQTLKPSVTDPIKPPISGSVTDPVTESKEKEKEKGLDITEAKASAAVAATDPEPSASDLWKSAVELLVSQGSSAATARTFLGGIRKQFTNPIADAVIQAAAVERPVGARAWMVAACTTRATEMPRTPKQLAQHSGFSNMNYEEGLNEDGTVK